jgi:hypothetical protein
VFTAGVAWKSEHFYAEYTAALFTAIVTAERRNFYIVVTVEVVLNKINLGRPLLACPSYLY